MDLNSKKSRQQKNRQDLFFLQMPGFKQTVIFVNRTVFGVPAEIFFHRLFLHIVNLRRLAVINSQSFIQGFRISILIRFQTLGRQVASEHPPFFGKEHFGTKTVNAVFYRINQAPGRHRYRQRSLGHGFHLRQTAGLKPARHHVKIRRQLNSISKLVFISAKKRKSVPPSSCQPRQPCP